MAAVLPEETKVRIRTHMGYLQVEAAATFALGVPAGVQTQFMIEGAMNRVLPSAVGMLLQILDRLDCIYCEIFGGVDTATITKLAEIEINPKRLRDLSHYYDLALSDLENLLGCVRNPWDNRWYLNRGINVSVS